MRAFEQLTARGQLRRVRKLAEQALESFDLADPVLTFVQHGENTTYRVDDRGHVPQMDKGVYIPNSYLLRVHSPTYNSPQEIESEMIWLDALRHDINLAVPEPVHNRHGTFTVQAEVMGVPQTRTVTLMRWMRGSVQWRNTKPHHLHKVGVLMARLHDHARTWTPPAHFTRRRWDWDGLFGANAHVDRPIAETMQRIPLQHRPLIEQIMHRYKHVLDEIGETPAMFGLIHGDLHLWNLLFADGEARAIDFDDCGFGYWLSDICITLGRWRRTPLWDAMLSAFIKGYETMMPFPHHHAHLINDMIVAREVGVLLWVVSKAFHDPTFQAYEPTKLEQTLDWIAAYQRGFRD